jgi:hypothetical protein
MDVPWVKLVWHAYYLDKVHPHAFFWWKDVLKLANHFRGVAAVKAGKGVKVICFVSGRIIGISMDRLSLSRKDFQDFPRLYWMVICQQLRYIRTKT